MTTRTIDTTIYAPNERAWAIGTAYSPGIGKPERFHIRRVVWGRLLAREEKRPGEVIKRVTVLVTGK
jgi:hypothetical protein